MSALPSHIKTTHLSPVEAAKRIRTALKAAFPGVKFSVRAESFSQGHAVQVTYTDGPALPQVEAIAEHYGSRSFNGADDSTTFIPGEDLMLTSEGLVQRCYGGFIHVQRNLSDAARYAIGFNPDLPTWHDSQPWPWMYENVDLRDLRSVRAQMDAESAS